MSIQFPILYRAGLSSLVSIKFPILYRVSLSSLVSIKFPLNFTESVWCQSSFLYCTVNLSSLVSIQFSYIVQSQSQQSGVNPVSIKLYRVSLISLVSIQFPILYRVSLSSLVSIQFPILYSQSQQSGVNPVFLYCTESVSAVWCQSSFH